MEKNKKNITSTHFYWLSKKENHRSSWKSLDNKQKLKLTNFLKGQWYGHTVKRCHETIATCAKRSCQGHNKDKCTCTEVRCCDRGDDQQAFSRNYPKFKRETEIVQIQTKERIPGLQAIRKLLRINAHHELIFSNAVKKESQYESSEDNLPLVPSYGYGYYTKRKR